MSKIKLNIMTVEEWACKGKYDCITTMYERIDIMTPSEVIEMMSAYSKYLIEELSGHINIIDN